MAGATANYGGVPGLTWDPRAGIGGYGHMPGTPSMYQAYQAANPWQPPPIPAGVYNPIRDIEAAEGKRGSEQQISGYERQKTDAEQGFGTSLATLKEQEGQAEGANRATLARLAESYKRLAARQGDQANADGLLYGGATLASGMKRAHNEGVQKAEQRRRYADQIAGFKRQEGNLVKGENERLEGLAELLKNARTNEQAFGSSIETLKGHEAALNGYDAPTGPGQKAVQWSHDPKVRARQLAQLKREGRA